MDKFRNSKSFASSSKKNPNKNCIDADSMIKNIISQQDTFVINKDHQLYSNLPKWMIPKSGCVHPLYEQIWQYVKSDKRDRTCDTNLVSQLLMSSGLSVDILGRLWSMANIGVEGSLSQQELYIILALITLVQNGYSVSNVSLLQHIHKPIIPQLNYALIEKKHYGSTVKPNTEYKLQQITNKSSNLMKTNNQQPNIYVNNFQHQNFNVISTENYDPLAVSFIEPKNRISRTMPMTPLTTNSEPKSLDFTPVNDSFGTFDDEFSDFQCAQFTNTDTKKNHEFTDFQSAFDTLSFKENTTKNVDMFNVSSVDITSNSLENQHNLNSYQNDVEDKYEVFRTLAAETIDVESLSDEYNPNDILSENPITNNKENIQNCDANDDEFGDFLCVEEVSSSKPEIEMDWKNVQIQCVNKCLEFLKEGYSTFSSISNDKVLTEVMNHDKGIKYLIQLELVNQICKRILKNCYCPSLEEDLTNVMSKLKIYLNNFTQKTIDNPEVLDETKEIIPCCLCKCNCSADSTVYMLNHYHSSCINLLMNFVQTSQLSIKLS